MFNEHIKNTNNNENKTIIITMTIASTNITIRARTITKLIVRKRLRIER